ncbi:DUF2721 domain-containing protein [Massilia sp. HP4]|uniref:DUF2721 domain-containing protein n=1 Tax=Massilia sp. HP4 TaxID=2562316 RepID=UPI0010BFE0DA|nr:DUF2721 domain-containing protein [Massilia sp. HP4]
MILELSDIGGAIQLAIAPVFLLAGVGTLLIALTNRLGRLIDRTRVLEDRLRASPGNDCVAELLSLHNRSYLINVSITASTACGLLVCVVIAMLFLGESTDLPLDRYIALCFIGGMLALIVGFVYFMREIFICCTHMRAQQMKVLAACEAVAG